MGEPEQVPDPHWWHSDRADSVGWGLAFIWGALVLLATNTGFGERYAWWDAWSVFFVGAGLISIAIAGVRIAATRQSEKPLAGMIVGLILLGIGLGDFVVWFWPGVLLIIGLMILRRVLSPNKRRR